MTKLNPVKVGLGSGSLLFGIYLVFNDLQNFWFVFAGLAFMALGIGLLASTEK